MNEVSEYIDFAKERNIEFCMVLCDQLYDDPADGITFACVKTLYNIFDIIELGRTTANDDQYCLENFEEKTGYDELIQALESFIWSNVGVNQGIKDKHLILTLNMKYLSQFFQHLM